MFPSNNPYYAMPQQPPAPQMPYQQSGQVTPPAMMGTPQPGMFPQYAQPQPIYPPAGRLLQYPGYSQQQHAQSQQPGQAATVPSSRSSTPQSFQQYAQPGQLQQFGQAQAPVAQAYYLVLGPLPVPAGQPIPPDFPDYEELLPLPYQHNGLPVYGPSQYVAPPQLQQLPRVNSMPAINSIQRPNSALPARRPVPSSAIGRAPMNVIEKLHRPEVIYHMLRHAHGGKTHFFETQYVDEQFHDIGDPALSSLGEEQCRNLRESLSDGKDAHYILLSPMLRARQTVQAIFHHPFSRKPPIKSIIWDSLRDCPPKDNKYKFCYKRGAKLAAMREELKGEFDLSLVRADWHKNFAHMNMQAARADGVRVELYKLAKIVIEGGVWNGIRFEKYTGTGSVHVTVVSHNNFLNFLTHRDKLPGKPNPQGDFAFLQCRSYRFAPESAIGQNGVTKETLVETKDSQQRKHPKDWKIIGSTNMSNQKIVGDACAVQ